jgi:putative ATPase
MGPRTYTLPVPPRTPRSPAPTPTLFAAAKSAETAPLAERMRPRSLEEYFGQEHLVGEGKLLARAITGDRLPSLVLWGPPGSGKTSLARVVAERTNARFVPFSAVLGNVAELREIVRQAKEALSYEGRRTIVFVDEIHRFNKAQQDAFLPHVEAGTIVLVGATTENPSFAINAALLSRCKVFRLEALSSEALMRILRRALVAEAGLGGSGLAVDEEVLRALAEGACGDARRALTSLEAAAELVRSEGGGRITMDALARADDHRPLLYDKAGDEHYNVVSAFIKSMRGTDPDAAVYWLMRMLEAGEDPLFVARRMIVFASEDVGNADPRALTVATSADAAFRRLGMPEGIYPLAHAALYLASTVKSNAVKNAWQRAQRAVRELGALPVPKKLRNAPTQLMRDEGYGAGYRYPHEHEGAVVPGETYLPDDLAGTRFYEPSDRGEESRIRQRLAAVRGAKPEPVR